jgi:hypothetical protein
MTLRVSAPSAPEATPSSCGSTSSARRLTSLERYNTGATLVNDNVIASVILVAGIPKLYFRTAIEFRPSSNPLTFKRHSLGSAS